MRTAHNPNVTRVTGAYSPTDVFAAIKYHQHDWPYSPPVSFNPEWDRVVV